MRWQRLACIASVAWVGGYPPARGNEAARRGERQVLTGMLNRRILVEDALVSPTAVAGAGALRGTALTGTAVARSLGPVFG